MSLDFPKIFDTILTPASYPYPYPYPASTRKFFVPVPVPCTRTKCTRPVPVPGQNSVPGRSLTHGGSTFASYRMKRNIDSFVWLRIFKFAAYFCEQSDWSSKINYNFWECFSLYKLVRELLTIPDFLCPVMIFRISWLAGSGYRLMLRYQTFYFRLLTLLTRLCGVVVVLVFVSATIIPVSTRLALICYGLTLGHRSSRYFVSMCVLKIYQFHVLQVLFLPFVGNMLHNFYLHLTLHPSHNPAML